MTRLFSLAVWTEDPLLAGDRHAERDHELIAGERLAVEHEHQPLGIIEPSVLEPPQLGRARPDESARHTRARQAERFGDRFRRRLVLAARQAAQHATEQADVVGTRRLQRGVRRQWDFAAFAPIAHPGHGDRQLLIGEIDRPGLRAPPHDVGPGIVAGVARTGQRADFREQCFLHGFQPQWDQRVNHGQRHRCRHGAIVQRERLRHRTTRHALLVLRPLLSYSWHGWCPRERVEILGRIHTLVPRHHLLFN